MYRNLTIAIPSRGRAENLETVKHLSREARDVTNIYVHRKELQEYKQEHPAFRVVPHACSGISEIRKHIIEECQTRYVCIIDDDVLFYYRPVPGDWHLKYLKNRNHFNEMMEFLMRYSRLHRFAHLSVSSREGANRQLADWTFNQRYTRFVILDKKQLKRVIFERVQLMEDFDISLQLLRQGKPSAICYLYSQGQSGGSNASGGCSEYRTMDLQRKSALRLSRLHEGFVKPVVKKTKTAWNGQERTDVTVYWKRAFESSGLTIEEYLDGSRKGK